MKLYPLPSRHDTEAIDTAHRMRAVLDRDVDEDLKAAAVKELDAELNTKQELFIAAWSYLASNERTAWKAYCKKG